jgi:hypothetical protein
VSSLSKHSVCVCVCVCPDSAFESQCRLPRITLAGSLLYFVRRQNAIGDADKHSERGTATALQDGRLENLVLLPGRDRRFFSLQATQTDPRAHMAYYSIGI